MTTWSVWQVNTNTTPDLDPAEARPFVGRGGPYTTPEAAFDDLIGSYRAPRLNDFHSRRFTQTPLELAIVRARLIADPATWSFRCPPGHGFVEQVFFIRPDPEDTNV